MIERQRIAKTPREHFMRAAEEQLEKFVRREIAFQQEERNERASKLGLPSLAKQSAPSHGRTRM